MKTKTFLLLGLLLLVGFALRFYTFDRKSLWMDEVYTYQDSRDGFKAQLNYYKEEPTYLHPPFFYMLTHLFYPFPAPERDLRIIPLIFGILSILMIFFLARLFSRRAALPCAFALTFMTYHIALSQEARSYSLLLFLGIASLYFFMKHLITGKKVFLLPAALLFALMFHTSYSSIPFIAFSQLLWFYRPEGQEKKPTVNSFLLLNALIVVLCSPWILFLLFHYTGQHLQDPLHTEDPGSFAYILYGVFHDWFPHWPLQVISGLLLAALPFFLKDRRNTLLLLALFILPIMGLYIYCKALHVTHFISSKYFVTFLPLLLISLFLSLDALEMRFKSTRKLLRFKVIFALVFLASNLAILPFYYRSEKQDNRGLVNYLKADLRDGDSIFLKRLSFFPGVLHYFGAVPVSRHYEINFSGNREDPDDYRKTLTYQNKTVTIYNSKTCCAQYLAGGNRLWIVVGKPSAETLKEQSPAVFKGYFDGSFLNFNRFPTDASFYLFLWDPSSPNEEGIDLPIPK
jgi:4-amino-4-deoxy-L-arabinose transferase-like glycosyltransferase